MAIYFRGLIGFSIICDLLYEKGPLGFFLNIEFLTWVDSHFFVEYNGESFKSKY